MTPEEKITLNEFNIRQALADYFRHTDETEIYDNVSNAFIERLARDNYYSKHELRELFRKSPAWDEKLDAIVINGSRTHDPDYGRIHDMACIVLREAFRGADAAKSELIHEALAFFGQADPPGYTIGAIKALAPKAYAPGKKITRVFRGLCEALGVVDLTPGSVFASYFAQIADELTSKKIDFKLFVSLNPAHFITMSNPKQDLRGNSLTSCHSFNSTEYEYNNGCSGYARDDYTFIVFTVMNPDNRETLNNRKNMRQIFWYKPDSGVLLQSRLYNTLGGTRREENESKVFRDLIQRELSDLEGQPNLWKTCKYCGNDKITFVCGDYFGGYPDWQYEDFAAKLSIRNDHESEYNGHHGTFKIGEPGLCICCGEEISSGLYCDCCGNKFVCDCCGGHFPADDLTRAFDENGDEIMVCQNCLENNYEYCDCCERYYDRESMTIVGDMAVCSDCLERYYARCDCCDEWVSQDEIHSAIDANGYEVNVCDCCLDRYFVYCDDCEELTHVDGLVTVYNERGEEMTVGACCADNYEECSKCGRLFPQDALIDGLCPDCAAEKEKDAE